MKVNKRHFLDNENFKCITITPMLQKMPKEYFLGKRYILNRSLDL